VEQRFTFIKTNEIKDDFDSEERVEVEVVMEENDLGQLEEKFSNFLKGCGYEDVTVSISEPRIEQDGDVLGDLDDELEDIDEVDNVHAFKKTSDYDGKPSDTE
tara:strand:- start:464 stop:772 length:309 start_codon:yes stop_codon:yes gene_type:complete